MSCSNLQRLPVLHSHANIEAVLINIFRSAKIQVDTEYLYTVLSLNK